jgi:spore germination protein Q
VADEFTGYPAGYNYGGSTQMPYVPQGTQGTPQVSTPYYPYAPQQMPQQMSQQMPQQMPQQVPMGTAGSTPGGGPGAVSPAGPAVEQSYIENILRLNKDREVTVYMTFEHAGGGESKAFTGHIEAAGRDHVIINETKTGTRYLLPLIYLDYVVFQGKVAYSYPYRK